eukprot:996185-Pleurochrysis_carterae.AAC.1
MLQLLDLSEGPDHPLLGKAGFIGHRPTARANLRLCDADQRPMTPSIMAVQLYEDKGHLFV